MYYTGYRILWSIFALISRLGTSYIRGKYLLCLGGQLRHKQQTRGNWLHGGCGNSERMIL